MYKIEYDKKALKQLQKIKYETRFLVKISKMIEEISLDPYSTTHKFERLKANYSGFCSKRIDKQNRLIYRVEEEKITVLIISVIGHYE
jgi:toxin YoeB